MERTTKKEATEADLTKPLAASFSEAQLSRQDMSQDCFTKLWSPRATECASCADNEVCGILYAQRVKKAVVEREQAEGTQFLDQSELSNLSPEAIYDNITARIGFAGEKISAAQFIEELCKKGRTDDEVAVVEWIKRFVTQYTPKIKIVNGTLVYNKAA